jgi:O-acetyl-ADP-ribose deacetylase (regulator of RNase III)
VKLNRWLAATEQSAIGGRASYENACFPGNCGLYGYPITGAADIAVGAITSFLATDCTMEQVTIASSGAGILRGFQAAVG